MSTMPEMPPATVERLLEMSDLARDFAINLDSLARALEDLADGKPVGGEALALAFGRLYEIQEELPGLIDGCAELLVEEEGP